MFVCPATTVASPGACACTALATFPPPFFIRRARFLVDDPSLDPVSEVGEASLVYCSEEVDGPATVLPELYLLPLSDVDAVLALFGLRSRGVSWTIPSDMFADGERGKRRMHSVDRTRV